MTIAGSLNVSFFGLLCGRCQTCCLGDGDSFNINEEFDNMNSVKTITDVMFKSRIINPAVTLFIMILINQMLCYNETNPKLHPVIFLFSQMSRSRSQVKGQFVKTKTQSLMISQFLTEIDH